MALSYSKAIRPNKDTLTVSGVDLLKPEEGETRRRFRMVGYTGATVSRLYGSAVFDLSGIEHGDQVPILFNHDDSQIAGFADTVELTDRGLELSGYLSSVTEAGQKVAALSDEGLKWQASVGLQVEDWEDLDAKQSAEVNGTKLSGPLSVGRRSRLLEVSFVTAGADKSTSAVALAAKEQHMTETNTREVLSDFLAAFPGREGWAAKQFAAGLDVPQTKAELANLLEEELAAKRKELLEVSAERDEARSKLAKLEALEAESRHPGVGFDGQGREDLSEAKPKRPLKDMSPGEAWDASEDLRASFGDHRPAFDRYVQLHGLVRAIED